METVEAGKETGLDPYCSYPTYEEWKQKIPVKISFHIPIVLILPMRNGNWIAI